MLLLAERKTGESWELSKSNALSESGEHCMEKLSHFVFQVLKILKVASFGVRTAVLLTQAFSDTVSHRDEKSICL
jgi:hypothetical protein